MQRKCKEAEDCVLSFCSYVFALNDTHEISERRCPVGHCTRGSSSSLANVVCLSCVAMRSSPAGASAGVPCSWEEKILPFPLPERVLVVPLATCIS